MPGLFNCCCPPSQPNVANAHQASHGAAPTGGADVENRVPDAVELLPHTATEAQHAQAAPGAKVCGVPLKTLLLVGAMGFLGGGLTAWGVGQKCIDNQNARHPIPGSEHPVESGGGDGGIATRIEYDYAPGPGEHPASWDTEQCQVDAGFGAFGGFLGGSLLTVGANVVHQAISQR